MRYAIIENDVVTNVAMASAPLAANWVHTDTAGVGWAYKDGVFTAPVIPTPTPEPKKWPAFDFYRKFTMAEYIDIKTLAKTDPVADYFLGTLDRAIASGSNVRADDPDTIAGLAYLEVTPAAKPCLAQGRAAELLA